MLPLLDKKSPSWSTEGTINYIRFHFCWHQILQDVCLDRKKKVQNRLKRQMWNITEQSKDNLTPVVLVSDVFCGSLFDCWSRVWRAELTRVSTKKHCSWWEIGRMSVCRASRVSTWHFCPVVSCIFVHLLGGKGATGSKWEGKNDENSKLVPSLGAAPSRRTRCSIYTYTRATNHPSTSGLWVQIFPTSRRSPLLQKQFVSKKRPR